MIRRHVLSCARLKGGDASGNGEDVGGGGGGGGYKGRNNFENGNNVIDVALGILITII